MPSSEHQPRPDHAAPPEPRHTTQGGGAPGSGGDGDHAPTAPQGRPLLESLLMFGGATLACAVLWQLRRVSGFINRNLQAFIAAIFLYLPTGLLLRRREDLSRYALTHRPLWPGVRLYLLTSAVVFPLFGAGFLLFYGTICSAAARGVHLPRQLAGLCRRYVGGIAGARLRLPPEPATLAAAQLLVVALPEEYFFRGYLQTRLGHVWPARRRFLGAEVGPALLWASVLFALGHLLVDFNPLRLAVFFPALVFGWMRQLTGSILASVLFHASSNLVSELLHASFF